MRIENISKEHLKIIQNPHYNRGAGFNPCLDCHLLMLKTAQKIMTSEGYDLVATGEVLGQRPLSQNQKALEILEKESNLEQKLLRPLSAKLLPITLSEKEGIINREKLYAIEGRARAIQYELAKYFGFEEIPQPGGGCILADLEYGRRLKN